MGLWVLAVSLGSLPAAARSGAADLVDVRIGKHSDHTRVVLETDGSASHRIEEGAGTVRVHLGASARARTLRTDSRHVQAVVVSPKGGGSEVRLDLRGPARLETLQLEKPPRLVIDLYAGRAPSGAAPTGAAAKPAGRETAAKPAATPATTSAARETAAPARDAASAPAGARRPLGSRSGPEAAGAQAPSAASAGDGPPGAGADADARSLTWNDLAAEEQDRRGARPASEARDPGDPQYRAELPLGSRTVRATPSGTKAAGPGAAGTAATAGRAPGAAGSAARSPGSAGGGIPRTTVVLGAIAVAGVGAYAFLRRRGSARRKKSRSGRLPAAPDPAGDDEHEEPAFLRRREPESPTRVMTLDGSSAASAAVARSASDAEASSQVSIFDEPEDEEEKPDEMPRAHPGAAPPAPRVESEADRERAMDLEPSVRTDESRAREGDTPGEPALDVATGADLPVATGADLPVGAGREAPEGAVVAAASQGALEERVRQLEGRLEEVLDAKERLERQLVAQTEELRVQRAAIARTQRVLRNLNRPEDEATEPAPKT